MVPPYPRLRTTSQMYVPRNTLTGAVNTSLTRDLTLVSFLPYKLSAVYAELENMYSAKRSKSLKTRPPPAPESLLDLDPPSCTDSPTLHANTGS